MHLHGENVHRYSNLLYSFHFIIYLYIREWIAIPSGKSIFTNTQKTNLIEANRNHTGSEKVRKVSIPLECKKNIFNLLVTIRAKPQICSRISETESQKLIYTFEIAIDADKETLWLRLQPWTYQRLLCIICCRLWAYIPQPTYALRELAEVMHTFSKLCKCKYLVTQEGKWRNRGRHIYTYTSTQIIRLINSGPIIYSFCGMERRARNSLVIFLYEQH